ncbi:MAG: Mammalian cell entry related domain protein [Marmoricola sp.]|nr:Mammalian cell entry related domain protein [Marmoricola sp.]
MMTNRSKPLLSALRPRTPKAMGMVVLAALALFAIFSFDHPRILTTLSPGQHLNAAFTTGYKLSPYDSNVKIAGVKVGVVTGLTRSATDGQIVSMKLDEGTREKLGSAPSANIRPTLLLGGTYYVELVPGGSKRAVADGSTIPVSRTTVPVELDKVISTVTPTASESVKGTVAKLDETLQNGGTSQVQKLIDSGPRTLGPASQVLAGLEGTRPDQDLAALVGSTQNLAAALTRKQGRLGSIIDNLDTASATLASTSAALAATISSGPSTLNVTRVGLTNLNATLDQLRVTATTFRPAANEMNGVLTTLGPVLKRARPVIANTRTVAQDARPLVQDLVPTATLATGVLDDFKGPVLDRLNGPITAAVMSPWHGTGIYNGGGNDQPLYKETGYLLAKTADVFQFHDNNGASGRLMAGVGLSTAGGIVDHSLEEYLQSLGFGLPLGPHEGSNANEPGGLSLPNKSGAPTKANGLSVIAQLLQLPWLTGSAK